MPTVEPLVRVPLTPVAYRWSAASQGIASPPKARFLIATPNESNAWLLLC